ncbi:TetR/AcrR family transcriptional regulator [Geodermatophilaceae bacterium NBWT11]|nr:TetR/AcrR family transcriptional regulator [Geodermatophilaceae bacterium NBWT11]
MTAADPPSSGSLRDRQKAATRELLRASAMEVFLDRGFAAATVDEIAAAAGSSRATFYFHFTSKAEVVSDYCADVLDPESLRVYALLEALDPADVHALRSWLDGALGYFERHRAVLEVAREAAVLDAALARLSATGVLDRCAQAAPHFLDRWPPDRRAVVRMRLEVLVLGLADVGLLWLGGRWPLPRSAVLDELVRSWQHGLSEPRETG